jgi:hypothetical protein
MLNPFTAHRMRKCILEALKAFIQTPTRRTFIRIVQASDEEDGCGFQDLWYDHSCEGCAWQQEDNDYCWPAEYEESSADDQKVFCKKFKARRAELVLKTIELVGIYEAKRKLIVRHLDGV